MKIDEQLVGKLAHLARIEVSADERRTFASQLPKIVEYVGQLRSIAAETVPLAETPDAHRRTDEASPSERAEAVLDLAPQRLDRFWKVPSVL